MLVEKLSPLIPALLFQLLVNFNALLALKPKYFDFLFDFLAIMIAVDILQTLSECLLSLLQFF
jgi:hypothetical protein